jgi:hypothetical protein
MIKQKAIYALFFLITLGFLSSCSRKSFQSAEVNFISGNEGTITMRSIGIGTYQEDAIIDAEKNALNVLLFRGLPKSNQKIALIGTNESEEKLKHKDYFYKLFDNQRYKTFIMSSIPITDLIRHKGGKKTITIDVQINLISLRKDLEQNNLIRSFGY